MSNNRTSDIVFNNIQDKILSGVWRHGDKIMSEAQLAKQLNVSRKNYCDMPLWKHIYHTLHSLDMWYINTKKYSEPMFHINNLNNLDVETDKILSRIELKHYYQTIEKKINQYLGSLTDDMFLSKPENCELTRFTLILAQHRHLHSHMGMLMGFIIGETGLWPRVIGLQDDIPIGEYGLFF